MLVARNRRLLALEWLNLLEDFLELMVVDILAPSVLVVVVAPGDGGDVYGYCADEATAPVLVAVCLALLLMLLVMLGFVVVLLVAFAVAGH